MKTLRCTKAFFVIGVLLVLSNCSKSEYSTYRSVDDAPARNVTQVQDGNGDVLLDNITNLADGYVGSNASGRGSQLPTLVLGVVTPEFSKTLTFGKKPDGREPTDLDIYPISSVAKMFTGLIAARGAANNDFNRDTPVGELLKSDIAPLVGDLTIGQLLTHRSGLIDMPKNLHFKESPNSPGTNYSRRELIECLQQSDCSLASSRPGTYLYSNLGLGLLGVALTDFYNKSYEQLLSEYFVRGLGMTDTHTRSFVTDESRIVKGLTANGAEVPPAKMGVLAGAGEILSTGRDMLILLETMLKPPAQWAEAVKIATTPISEGRISIGYAIESRNIQSMVLLGKAGSQAGYSSLIMWSPELQAGAFALTNKGNAPKTLALLLRGVIKEINAHSKGRETETSDEGYQEEVSPNDRYRRRSRRY
jgi:CubicO group peptidase (beta-lactamase class C family)